MQLRSLVQSLHTCCHSATAAVTNNERIAHGSTVQSAVEASCWLACFTASSQVVYAVLAAATALCQQHNLILLHCSN
jgi:hypothetical protein